MEKQEELEQEEEVKESKSQKAKKAAGEFIDRMRENVFANADDYGNDMRTVFGPAPMHLRLRAAWIDLAVYFLIGLFLFWMNPTLALVGVIIVSIVFSAFTTTMFGGTIGQRLFRLVVLDEEGLYLSIGKAFSRSALGALGYSMFTFGFLKSIGDKKNLTLHDSISKTVVACVDAPASLWPKDEVDVEEEEVQKPKDDEEIPYEYDELEMLGQKRETIMRICEERLGVQDTTGGDLNPEDLVKQKLSFLDNVQLWGPLTAFSSFFWFFILALAFFGLRMAHLEKMGGAIVGLASGDTDNVSFTLASERGNQDSFGHKMENMYADLVEMVTGERPTLASEKEAAPTRMARKKPRSNRRRGNRVKRSNPTKLAAKSEASPPRERKKSKGSASKKEEVVEFEDIEEESPMPKRMMRARKKSKNRYSYSDFQKGIRLIKQRRFVEAERYMLVKFPLKEPQNCKAVNAYSKLFYHYGRVKTCRFNLRKVIETRSCGKYRDEAKRLWVYNYRFPYYDDKGRSSFLD